MPDYIPSSDDAFNTWQNQNNTYLNANLVNLGIPIGPPADPDVTAINAAKTDWTTKYTAHIAAQAAARAAAEAKDASRAAYEVVIRRLMMRLQASSSVDDAERAALGITVPDRIPTAVGPPASKPVLQADTSQRLRITINFSDEGTPTSRAKPAGVIGMELWMKLGGPPPTDLSECQYLATDSRTPYTANFDGSEANQTAHFIGRWMSTRNEPGPLSETVSATVPG